MDMLSLLTTGTRFTKKNHNRGMKIDPNFKNGQKRQRTKIQGTDCEPITDFDQLKERYDAPDWLLTNLKDTLKFKEPTSAQQSFWPLMLEKYEVVGTAPTGSGKTMAYLVPLLSMLRNPSKSSCRVLIVVPSRELSQQLNRELEILMTGKKFRVLLLENLTLESPQPKRLDIVISTPARLLSFLQASRLDLSSCTQIVFDEADKLFQNEMLSSMDEICSFLHSDMNESRRIHFFSATGGDMYHSYTKQLQRNSVQAQIGTDNSSSSQVLQKLLYVSNEQGKLYALKNLLKQEEIVPPALIFVNSIQHAKTLLKELIMDGYMVDYMHGERSPAQRNLLIENFRSGKIWLLICTDVMARGIDFKNVNFVINYDLPETATTYIHRVGRTGRGEKNGVAITFYMENEMEGRMKNIIKAIEKSGNPVPEFLKK